VPDQGPLTGRSISVVGDGPTARHARELLACLGAGTDGEPGRVIDLSAAPAPLADWAGSGAMALSGRPDGPPLAAPGNPGGATRAALTVFAELARDRVAETWRAAGVELPGVEPPGFELPGVELLGERAALAGFARRGPWSCGEAFRIVAAQDGWLGISLPREDDLSLVPALVEDPRSAGDPWAAVAEWAAWTTAAAAAGRAQLLGIAAAVVSVGAPPSDAQREHRLETARAAGRDSDAVRAGLAGRDGARSALLLSAGGVRKRPERRPLVLDLSSLWAGPLCGHLLTLAGAEVVKIESTRRPDGARSGPPEFFALLHSGQASVALDLGSPAGVKSLRQLVAAADVVLEASRPRAFEQWGIDAAEVVANGTIWTSITGYGRTGPWANRVGFGDDVAAAGGLVCPDGDQLLVCGDALADPLAGVHAAAATMAALLSEQAHLIDLSMRDIAAWTARDGLAEHRVSRDDGGHWQLETADGRFVVGEPVGRRPRGRAVRLGHDTAAIMARLSHADG